MSDIRLFPRSNAAGWVVFASGSSQPLTSPASFPLLDKCAALSALISKVKPSSLKGDYANIYRLDAVLLKGARPEVAAKLSLSSPLDAPGLDDFKADCDAFTAAVKSLSVAPWRRRSHRSVARSLPRPRRNCAGCWRARR